MNKRAGEVAISARLSAATFIVSLLAPILLGSCSAVQAQPETNAQAEAAEEVTALPDNSGLVSQAFKLSVPRLMSPEYEWLRQSIQNTGEPVYASDFPWQVGMRIRHGQGWRCGGTLINRQFILTAAHCLDGRPATAAGPPVRIGLASIDVFHGDDDFGEGVRLALDPNWPVTFHPQWKNSSRPYAFDAALLRLAAPVSATVVAPVRAVAVGEVRAVVSGWGDFDATNQPSSVLRAVELPVVSNDTCMVSLPDDYRSNVTQVTLCAVSRTDDACVRDSGGPLVIGSATRPQMIGIVSWGPPGSCGVPGYQGLLVGAYTRVSEIAPWIIEKTGDPAAVTTREPERLFTVRPRNDI